MADNVIIEELLAKARSATDTAVKEAFEAGFKAGGEAVRQSILAAAAAPIESLRSLPVGHIQTALDENAQARQTLTNNLLTLSSEAHEEVSRRAPRGLVADIVRRVLGEAPGLSISEIEARANALAPEVSSKSVGNELRRREGDAYVRRGKYSWFLKGQEPQEQTGEAEPRRSTLDILEGGEDYD